ncbi:MAG: nuclear transport factor 2 family protein [Candidatus Hodarchaeales archaeon]
MNNEQDKPSEMIREFLNKKMFDFLNTGNLESFGNFFSDQILFKNPGFDEPITDIKSFLEWWKEIFVIWENRNWEFNNLEKIKEDFFKCSYTFTGTHFLTQMTVQIAILANIKVHNGKITELENIFDANDFIRQAGF